MLTIIAAFVALVLEIAGGWALCGTRYWCHICGTWTASTGRGPAAPRPRQAEIPSAKARPRCDPQTGTIAGRRLLAAPSHWVDALLLFTDGRWAVYEPDRCFTSVALAARNDQLRDPGDVNGTQRWASRHLDASEDCFRAGHDPALPADYPLRRVTEWRHVIVDTVREVHGSTWLPLYSATPVCLIPFRGLRHAMGAVCACMRSGGDR